ncbi:hypothetical protein A9404_08325 [Halothiobacillus diazotrophicus]|uniref:DUF2946 domain-containing protein n=1 Tax=Halothiobacillus diazotrophicus TaxID=1860122 RepID=A0A191ZHQ5_9GAMM|nr:hypothetical protein [Halothiobacillus diazotrophicus]ANJ67387.1 hypothetical protein A9404_08325 [Halothiobacillus diazotrophicus]
MMKTPRILRLLILLLAVWLPLDNAVAGAVIADCPIMSHAFEKGVAATIDAPHQPAIMSAMPTPHAPMTTSSNGCCEHCGVCLLLGGIALPSVPATIVRPTLSLDYSTAPETQGPVGVHTLPFRPPIV